MNTTVNFNYRADDGSIKAGSFGLEDYQKASRAGQSVRAYMALKYPDADANAGTAFQQLAVAAGFDLNPASGNRPSMADLMDGSRMRSSITAPDGQDRTIAGRLLMPEIVLGMQEANLYRSRSRLREAFMQKIAMRTNVDSRTYYRPIVNTDTNKDFVESEIGQDSTPNVLVNITTSQRGYAIPTTSFGVRITDQAIASSSLDQIAMMLGSARRAIDNARIYKWIDQLVNGDARYGIPALTPVNLSSFDSAITGSEVTQKAWLKLLLDPQEFWEGDTILTGDDSFLAIQDRGQRPTVSDDTGRDNRLNAGLNPMNVSLQEIDAIVVKDSSILGGANNFLLFDSMQSIEYAQNTSATYEAVQQYVMRRATEMRFDTGEEVFRYRDDAMMLVTRA